jgi:hypothetical protein
MTGSIEDFAKSLPKIDGWDEAIQIYRETNDVENFLRIELDGIHESPNFGMQMVYAIGHGGLLYDGGIEGLFYFPNMPMGEWFGKNRDDRNVKAIPLYKINRIRLLQVSPEESYSKTTDSTFKK